MKFSEFKVVLDKYTKALVELKKQKVMRENKIEYYDENQEKQLKDYVSKFEKKYGNFFTINMVDFQDLINKKKGNYLLYDEKERKRIRVNDFYSEDYDCIKYDALLYGKKFPTITLFSFERDMRYMGRWCYLSLDEFKQVFTNDDCCEEAKTVVWNALIENQKEKNAKEIKEYKKELKELKDRTEKIETKLSEIKDQTIDDEMTM